MNQKAKLFLILEILRVQIDPVVRLYALANDDETTYLARLESLLDEEISRLRGKSSYIGLAYIMRATLGHAEENIELFSNNEALWDRYSDRTTNSTERSNLSAVIGHREEIASALKEAMSSLKSSSKGIISKEQIEQWADAYRKGG